MENQEKDNRTFAEIYKSLGLNDRRTLVRSLSTCCKVDSCTVRNWGSGIRQPRPFVRPAIVRTMRRVLGLNVSEKELFKNFNI